MELYSAIKRRKLLIHTLWMNFKIFCYVKETKQQRLYITLPHLHKISIKSQFCRQPISGFLVLGLKARINCKWAQISLSDRNTLKPDFYDNCITL